MPRLFDRRTGRSSVKQALRRPADALRCWALLATELEQRRCKRMRTTMLQHGRATTRASRDQQEQHSPRLPGMQIAGKIQSRSMQSRLHISSSGRVAGQCDDESRRRSSRTTQHAARKKPATQQNIRHTKVMQIFRQQTADSSAVKSLALLLV